MNKDDSGATQPAPAPRDDAPAQSNLQDEFNRAHEVGQDLDIDPDPDLQGYQDDINTGNKVEIDDFQDPNGIGPDDVLLMPRHEVKREFDQLAADDLERLPDEDSDSGLGSADDRREHIEDMDEGDKRHDV